MRRSEQAAAAVAAARATFADASVLARMSDDEVAALAAQTADLARVVQAQQVRLAGAIDARSDGTPETDLCRKLGKHNAKEAVASTFGIRVREAQELLSMAKATGRRVSLTGGDIDARYPQVATALDEGELTLSQARAIVTVLEPAAPRADLEQLAWAEGCLVAAAVDPEAPLAPELLVEQGRAFAAVLDPDGVLPQGERQRAARSLRLWQQADGMWPLRGLLPPEEGSALKAALDAYDAPRVKPCFVEEGASAPREADAGAIDDRTREQRQHDILVGMIRAQASSGKAPVAGGERPRLVFNITEEAYDAYRRGVEHPDRTLQIEHTGALVPIETVDRLLCDGVVQRAVVSASGEVLDLGRTERTFDRSQRRALAAQYGGCANCGLPVAWSEAHHVVWWSRGGTTDVKNGILLCSHCHHEVHAGRLVVVGEPGDWRVVAQLRPVDPFARASRAGTARARGVAGAPGLGQLARAAVARGVLAAAMSGAEPVPADPMDAEPPAGTAARAAIARATIARGAVAAPALAVRIPAAPQSVAGATAPPGSSSVEVRIRGKRRVLSRTGPRVPACRVDHRPRVSIVMRN